MRKLIAVALPIAWAVLTVPVGATGSRHQTPVAQNVPATGLIAGKVIEDGSGRPVEEAVVTLDGPADEQRRVMVDGQGRFVFPGLAAGRYRLASEQFGYLPGRFGSLRPSGLPLPIDLLETQRVTDANISMWRLVSITGRVLDEAGEPIVGISVRPLRRSVQRGQAVLTPSFSGFRALTTDDRGVYRASMLPPGDYAIAVPARVSTFPVDVMRDIPGSGVSLGISETAPLGDFRNLQIGNNILTTTSRAPLPPAREGGSVTVYQTTFYPNATSASEAAVLSLQPGENRTGVDVRLSATPTVSVSGQIGGPDGPLPLTAFKLIRAGGSPSSEEQEFETATGITDARGRFTLLGVPKGEYVLRVRASRPAAAGVAGFLLSAAETVTVGDSDVANVVVTARRAATLSGRVEFRGKPVAPLEMTVGVEAIDAGPTRLANPRLDKDYRFSLDVLPGRYLVWAGAGGDISCVATSGGRAIWDELLQVAAENISDIAIVCGDAPSRIAGSVRDERGQPDRNARVVVFSTEKRFWSGDDYRPLRRASARVGGTGTYSISNLPPGDYFVVAISERVSLDEDLPQSREKLIPLAARVTVGLGELQTVNLSTAVIK